jgi:hypothetical protein
LPFRAVRRSIEHLFEPDRGELQGAVAALCGLLHATTASLVAVLAQVLSTEAWREAGSALRCTG